MNRERLMGLNKQMATNSQDLHYFMRGQDWVFDMLKGGK